MATLLEQLQREADDLCGHRGLVPGSDHQTFSMSLPTKLRNYYDKVVTPATGHAALSGAAGSGKDSFITQDRKEHFDKADKMRPLFQELTVTSPGAQFEKLGAK